MIATTIGMDCAWKAWASRGLASTSTLASTQAPLASLASFSSTGLSCLHGPHHSAHRSTITGVVRDRWTTSSLKVSSVTSNTDGRRLPGAGLASLAVGRAGGPVRCLLPALGGGLPGTEIDGTVHREVPRLLHVSILPQGLA